MGRPLHLVSYDVRCPKRWRRVFGTLKRQGAHRQLSVFLVRLEASAMQRLQVELTAAIDPEQDSVLIARIDGQSAGVVELGRPGPLPGARILLV